MNRKSYMKILILFFKIEQKYQAAFLEVFYMSKSHLEF